MIFWVIGIYLYVVRQETTLPLSAVPSDVVEGKCIVVALGVVRAFGVVVCL